MRIPRRWGVLLLLGLLVTATACQPAAFAPAQPASADRPAPPSLKRITAGIRGAPKALSQQKTQPQLGSVPGLDAIEQLVHAGLVSGDAQGQLIPQLAEMVPSIENGLWVILPDGRMTTTWRIKDTARWQDGVPVTTQDLLFAVQVEQDRELAIPRHAVYNVFRRAMLHAIDRQQMVESLVGGLSMVAHTFVEPGSPQYDAVAASAVRYEFDPRRSAQFLEELGYRKGGDGLIRDGTGLRLAIEFQTTAQNLIHPKALAIVAADWEQLGVGVEQVVIPIQRSQDAAYRASFPAFELSGGSIDVTSRGVLRYHSTSTPLPENGFQNRGNESRYMNPGLDALIERYVTTIPWPARMDALAQIVQHQSEQVTLMGLFYRPTPTFLAARLINVTAGSAAGAVRSTEAWNAHDWDVK